jgi:GTP-binding protein EngB required for normal cell division
MDFDLDGSFDLKLGNLSDEKVEYIRDQVRRSNDYLLEEAEIRNVLMVGRSRTGKSTACGVLKDPCYEPKQMSIFADTWEPKFNTFAIKDEFMGAMKKYCLALIDSPGLDEVKPIGQEKRQDQTIMDTIKYCVRNEITKIHCLFLFVSFAVGLNNSDINAFKMFFEQFYHQDLKVAVVISRSEDKDQNDKKMLIDQLLLHPFFSDILAKGNVSVLFMGCVDQNMLQIGFKEQVKAFYVHTYQMRKTMLEFIFSAENAVSLADLPINRVILDNWTTAIERMRSILKKFKECKDGDLPWVFLEAERFDSEMKELMKHDYLQTRSELFEHFSKLRDDLLEVRDSNTFRNNTGFIKILTKNVSI